jgi:isoquinoline 1-oxidoreductase subunit beta
MSPDLTRREFLTVAALASGALVLGGPASAETAPNAFIRISPDGSVTVTVKHLEMGQGVATGLPVIVAEELSVPWSAIRTEFAPSDARRYNNLSWGPLQGTGGSSSMANSWAQLRQCAAALREMLCTAAALRWNVVPAEVVADQGRIRHPASGRALDYAALIAQAARLPVPQQPRLKDPATFTLIGREGAVRRTDGAAKCNGSAVYAMDLRLPDMVVAVVARPPSFGATLVRIKDRKARAVPGVRTVVTIPSGVAVVADDTWAALQGREALDLTWSEGPMAGHSTATLRAAFTELLATPGLSARNDGDAESALTAPQVSATYELPYLAHVPMEPLTCVVRLSKGRCEIWAGCQSQTADQAAAAKAAGLRPEQVEIHTLLAGGSFGRRANPTSDYIVEAVEIAKHADGPVKLMWTREDDIKGGSYRPFTLHKVDAALDETGQTVAWRHRIVSQSILAGTYFESAMVSGGIDRTSVEGAASLPYAIPNLAVELHSPSVPVPVLWWRSVGSSHTAFATECAMDELAFAAGRDPIDFRRPLLAAHPRLLAVLELAAAQADWTTPLPTAPGHRRGRGFAVHESFKSCCAQVAEVTVDAAGQWTIDRVICAIDCGIAVTPDIVRQQIESGIIFGLSAALFGEITLRDGRVEQANFHDYPILRLAQSPKIQVHIAPSAEPPTGTGEPGVPPIAPAVANALFAATGRRIRALPIGDNVG